MQPEPVAALLAVLAQRSALAITVLGDDQQRLAPVVNDIHAGHFVVPAQADGAHASGGAAHHAHVPLVEADAHAVAGDHDHVLIAGGGAHPAQVIVLVQAHGHQAVAAHGGESADRHALDAAPPRAEHEVARCVLEGGHGGDGCDVFLRLESQEGVDQRALRAAPGFGDHVGALRVDLALIGEEQHMVERSGSVEMLDRIFFAGGHAGDALAAAPLRAVGDDRHALDVTALGQADQHFFVADQVAVHEVGHHVERQLGATVVAVLLGERVHVVADEGQNLAR